MLETGKYGAKVQSWHHASPRNLLKRLIEENPKADKKALLKLMRAELLSEDGIDYLYAVIEYWFSNNYDSISKPPEKRRAERVVREKAVAKVAEVVRAKAIKVIEEKAQIMLLDMVKLPTGKTLRESTGKECAKAGGWLSRIAEKVKPGQMVGAALSEDEVRALFKAR